MQTTVSNIEFLSQKEELEHKNALLELKLKERTFSLENSVKYMRSLLDLAAGYIFVVDKDEIIDGSQSFLVEFGYTTISEIQADMIEAYRIVDNEKVECKEILTEPNWVRYILLNSNELFRIKLKRDQKIYNFEVYARSLLYKTGVSDIVYAKKNYVVVSLNEISRLLLEIEKNRQKDHILIHQNRLAAMGEMVASIAHQWRQPLNTIFALNQNILFKLKNEACLDNKYLFDTIKKELELIRFLSDTIDTFKDFFSPQKERISFDLSEVIKNALLFIKSSSLKSNIEYEVNIKEPIIINGFRNELVQVLLIILQNAKDVLESKSLDKKVVKIELFKENKEAIIRIEDNGGGIDPKIMDRIFELYFTTKGKSGSGIGLYMANMIVKESFNGKIVARNGEFGAIFEIVLPI